MALRRVPARAASVPRGGGLFRRLRALLGGRPVVSPAAATALRARRDALAARLQEERRAFGERDRFYQQHPAAQGGLPLPEVEQKLTNLYRIRARRLEAAVVACQRELAALEGSGGTGA